MTSGNHAAVGFRRYLREFRGGLGPLKGKIWRTNRTRETSSKAGLKAFLASRSNPE